jgi:DNA adenine methylase
MIFQNRKLSDDRSAGNPDALQSELGLPFETGERSEGGGVPKREVNTRPSLCHPEASLGASWQSDRFADRARGIAGGNVASHGEWTRLRFKRPFLKWAGSKFKILPEILARLPQGNRLVEPFVGSGAVFLNAGYRENRVADANRHLIGTFLQIKMNLSETLAETDLLFVPECNTEEAFYRLRAEFNADATPIPRHAALFIYLNRHCFNGLCRFNRSGHFNVPFGRYKGPVVPKKEILNFSVLAQKTEFASENFLATMAHCQRGDVVYCDPPYAPLTATANFTSYSTTDFGESDQRALADAASQLAAKGIPVVISNHDTSFTRELYAKAKCSYLSVQRYISCDSTNRAAAPEVVALFD